MSQDGDVDRLTAALKGPVLRYRSFGNGPTRTPPDRPAPSLDAALDEAAAMLLSGGMLPRLGVPSTEAAAPPDAAPDAPPAETVVVSRAVTPEPDTRPMAAPPPRGLLERLRGDAAGPAPSAEGLLALLNQPAAWDLPPPETTPPPLVGQPIPPWMPGPPPDLFRPPPPGRSAPAVEPSVADPVAEPSAARPMAEPAIAGPAVEGAVAASPDALPLAAVFRLLAAPPSAMAAARTESLQDVLRGLRSGRPG